MAIFRNEQIRSKAVAAAMIVGGGISGMRAALDLADAGLKVFLVEQTPCLGGRVAQLGFMFPQHDCVLCRGTSDHGYGCTRPSISPAYIHHNQHPNIEILTNTPAGEAQPDGSYPGGTVNYLVDHRLRDYVERFKELGAATVAERQFQPRDERQAA